MYLVTGAYILRLFTDVIVVSFFTHKLSEENKKTRELEAEAVRLDVEAEILEKEAYDPDSLQQMLKDFEDETISISLVGETVGSKVNDLRGNSTSEVVTVATSTPIKHQKKDIKFEDKEVSCNESQAGSATNTIILRSSLDSLPKSKIDTFDGDPFRWSDWISMFQSIIDKANISCT